MPSKSRFASRHRQDSPANKKLPVNDQKYKSHLPMKFLYTSFLKLPLIFFIVFATSPAFARVFGQTMTLTGKNIPLSKVFQEIQDQTGYVVFIDHSLLEQSKKVTLSVRNATVQDVLAICIKSQPVLMDYLIEGTTITLFKKKAELLQQRTTEPEPIASKGVVLGENGIPLVGATVSIKGLGKQMITDDQGEFDLSGLPPGKYRIEVSFIGYEKLEQEITLTETKKKFRIDLKLQLNNLDQTVVKGYYTTTKRLNTGNVSTVKSEVLNSQPVTDPLTALEGRIPGLYIAQTSGMPGADMSVIRLRGQNSIANGNNPLFIVDGVPFNSNTLTNVYAAPVNLSPFNNLNMSDIESIEVLKDADATAIYGSRGANGVILITTKKGKSGKTRFDLNGSTGWGKIARKMKLLNTRQYLMMRHESFYNDSLENPTANIKPGASDYDINGTWDTTRYTDWQKVFIGNTAKLSNVEANVSGGDANTQFLIGLGRTWQTTVFPGDFMDKKTSVHLNLNHTSLDGKFNIQTEVSYINDNNLQPSTDLSTYVSLAPDAPPLYNPDGTLYWKGSTWNNPFATLNIKSTAQTNNLISNLRAKYVIFKGLQANVSMGYNNTELNQSIITPITAFNPSLSGLTILRRNWFASNNIKSWIVEPQLNFSKQFGVHRVEVLAGLTFSEQKQDGLSQQASNFTSDELIPNVKAAVTIGVNSFINSVYHYAALYGRASYSYNDKYLVNFTARRDVSSRFGPGRQFGNFGAIGIGWIFSKEELFKHIGFLSFGKIRASYGITGNDQLPDYQYLSTYTPYGFNYQGLSGLYPTRIPNPNFGWEQVRKLEGGLELGFIKDRVLLSVSYYRNRTNNQLVGYPLPSFAGPGPVQANLPALIQNTGVEIELNSFNVKIKDFFWNTSINLSIPRNKLISYPNLAQSSYASSYVVGQPLYIRRLYDYTGVDPQRGVYTYTTKNADGIPTNLAELTKTGIVGQNYYGGIDNTFQYKKFQLSIFLQFVKQTGPNPFLTRNPPGWVNLNQPTYVLNRWQQKGDVTDIQKFTQGGAVANLYYAASRSDLFVTDASFIRLKNINLSYVLPDKIAPANVFKEVKFYIQGQNLLTITNYKGPDPETQNLNLPPIKMIIVGLKLGL